MYVHINFAQSGQQYSMLPTTQAGLVNHLLVFWGVSYYQVMITFLHSNNQFQFFGNAITCRSWDDIWLNEGFANFYEQKAMALIPEYEAVSIHGYWNRVRNYLFSFNLIL